MSARVLMVVEQLRRAVPGGIGRYASGLLAGLIADGGAEGGGEGDAPPRPDLALLASRAPGQPDPLARWGFPVRASALPGPVLTRAWDHGLVPAPGGFDVVHAVSLAAPPVRGGFPGGGGAPRRRRPALVVTVHDVVWRQFPEATTRRGRRWHEGALRRALRQADALIVPSAAAAAELQAAGAREGTVSVLRWGVDHLPPPDREGAAVLLRHLGVHGEYLLCAGTREPRKNLHRLVAAYAEARRSMPEPWPLLVVGPEGWGDAALGVDATPGSPVPNGVIAAGLVTDEILAALYEGARAFAYVPLAEGYGLPPLEAMTFGIPVVASTGVPSAAPVGGAEAPALRVDPLDVEAIAEALVRAVSDEPLRAALGERGRALVAGKTWRAAARWHVELWDSLA